MKISLSDSEWKIMLFLWDHPFCTITQVTAGLKKDTGWTKNTVITLLNRMEVKGAVTYREGERAKHYYPLIQREVTQVQESLVFIDKVFNGEIGNMLRTMMDQNALSLDEIEELLKILRKAD